MTEKTACVKREKKHTMGKKKGGSKKKKTVQRNERKRSTRRSNEPYHRVCVPRGKSAKCVTVLRTKHNRTHRCGRPGDDADNNGGSDAMNCHVSWVNQDLRAAMADARKRNATNKEMQDGQGNDDH